MTSLLIVQTIILKQVNRADKTKPELLSLRWFSWAFIASPACCCWLLMQKYSVSSIFTMYSGARLLLYFDRWRSVGWLIFIGEEKRRGCSLYLGLKSHRQTHHRNIPAVRTLQTLRKSLRMCGTSTAMSQSYGRHCCTCRTAQSQWRKTARCVCGYFSQFHKCCLVLCE